MWKSCIIKSDILAKVIEHEKYLVSTKKHQPLYYYVVLKNNKNKKLKLSDFDNYVSKNIDKIKILNGIVDEDANGYTVLYS